VPRLCAIPKPDLADGFRLAGAEVHPAASAELAREVLRELLRREDVGLIALDGDYYSSLDDRLKRQLDREQRPIVVALPVGQAALGPERRSAYVAALIQRATGLRMAVK
jgi:V/A-type H+-transporting ATPase subunit F